MNILNFLSWFAVVLLAASYWFQIWKIHRYKEVRDLSIKYHILLAIGFGILIFTALHEGSTIFLVKQISTFIPVVIIIYQIKYFKNKNLNNKKDKFCKNCKLEIKHGWKYCPSCGIFNNYCFRNKIVLPRLYCIIDKNLSPNKNVLEDIRQMCEGGCKIIQLREKNISFNDYLELAKKAKKITKEYNAKLIINDSIEVAHESKADGVHLGQSDGPVEKACDTLPKGAIIGISVSSLEEFYKAKRQNPTYIAVGSIFSTQTKKSVKVVGIDLLKKICDSKGSTPIVAIGGINKTNYEQVMKQGVDSIAMISEILQSKDIKLEIKDLNKKLKCKIQCKFNRIMRWFKTLFLYNRKGSHQQMRGLK